MKLLDPTFSISGTYNIQGCLTDHARSLLLPDGRAEFFLSIAEHEMHVIGEPTFTHDEYDVGEKGYGNEWYFKTNDDRIVAIGFRWGSPRLRGNCATTVRDVVEFVDFLQSRLSEA